MSKLQTYDRQYDTSDDSPVLKQDTALPWPFYALDGKEIRTKETEPGVFVPDDVLSPGDYVTHTRLKGFGVIVAISDEQLTILWSQEPETPGFGNFAMPAVRRVFPQKVMNDLVKIQPMTQPSGLIFYLDYTYGGNPALDQRCNSGPRVSRMFYRGVRWLRQQWKSTSRTLTSLLTRVKCFTSAKVANGVSKRLNATNVTPTCQQNTDSNESLSSLAMKMKRWQKK